MVIALSIIVVVLLGTGAAVVHADGRTAIDGTAKPFPYLPPSNLALVDWHTTGTVTGFVGTALPQILVYNPQNPAAAQQAVSRYVAPGFQSQLSDFVRNDPEENADHATVTSTVAAVGVRTLTKENASVFAVVQTAIQATVDNHPVNVVVNQFVDVTLTALPSWQISNLTFSTTNVNLNDPMYGFFTYDSQVPADRCGSAASVSRPSPNADLTEQELAAQRDLAISDAQPLVEQLTTVDPANPAQTLGTWTTISTGALRNRIAVHSADILGAIHAKETGHCPGTGALVSLDLTKGTATALIDNAVDETTSTGPAEGQVAMLVSLSRTSTGWLASDFQSWDITDPSDTGQGN